jgi:hypothetical protein
MIKTYTIILNCELPTEDCGLVKQKRNLRIHEKLIMT